MFIRQGLLRASVACCLAASSAAPPRLFYINDHAAAGCDPDNEQTLVHLLFHADLFEWEGLVGEGGTNCATRQGHLPPGHNSLEVMSVLDAYEDDYPALARAHNSSGLPGAFPEPPFLRSLVTQGVNESSPAGGLPPTATAASKQLIAAARRFDPTGRPLWVVTGGSLADVSRALYDAPDIIPRIRLFSIGSWNTEQDPESRRRVASVAGVWWVEVNSSFRGVYLGGNQSGLYNDTEFIAGSVSRAGALGKLYAARLAVMKEGDMPGFLFLMTPPSVGSVDDPTAPHWGGQYRALTPNTPLGRHGPTAGFSTYWSDLATGSPTLPQFPGAQTVSRWRVDILNLWLSRLRWLLLAKALVSFSSV